MNTYLRRSLPGCPLWQSLVSLGSMKFTDGFWLLKHGVRPYYALQVVHSSEVDGAYELQVSTKPIRHRGDTLGGPLLSVKVHSPTENVIGVKIDHFGVRFFYTYVCKCFEHL